MKIFSDYSSSVRNLMLMIDKLVFECCELKISCIEIVIKIYFNLQAD